MGDAEDVLLFAEGLSTGSALADVNQDGVLNGADEDLFWDSYFHQLSGP